MGVPTIDSGGDLSASLEESVEVHPALPLGRDPWPLEHPIGEIGPDKEAWWVQRSRTPSVHRRSYEHWRRSPAVRHKRPWVTSSSGTLDSADEPVVPLPEMPEVSRGV